MPMSYSTLIGSKSVDGSIRAWLNNATIPATTVLEEAEQYVYERLRAVEMRGLNAVAISSGAESFAFPARWAAFDGPIMVDGTGDDGRAGTMVNVSPSDLQAMTHYEAAYQVVGTATTTYQVQLQGVPRAFTPSGTASGIIYPAADADYNLRFWFWQRPSTLGTDNETNFVTTRFPRMLRAACMAGGNEWLKDDQEKVYWLQVCEAEIARANLEAERALNRDLHAFVTTR